MCKNLRNACLQAVKSGVVWSRQSGNSPAGRQAAVAGASPCACSAGWAETWLAWEQLQRYHGFGPRHDGPARQRRSLHFDTRL